jgi:hypothetical protein
MSNLEHTPTPWKAEYIGDKSLAEALTGRPTVGFIGDYRITAVGVRGYDLHAEDAIDAEFVVKAANSHAALVAALQQIIDMNVQYAIDRYGDAAKAETMACVSVARAALSQAKGDAS